MTKPKKGRFEVYEDEAGEHRWRFRAGNGEIMASSEGYTTKEDARRGAQDMADNASAVTGKAKIKDDA